MARGIQDSRQIGLRRFLEQLGNRTHHEGTADAKPAGVSELDNLLDSIDLELTPPLRLDASNPADLEVSVGPAIVTNTENNRNRSIPHIGSLLPNDFAAGTITFSADSEPEFLINFDQGTSETIETDQNIAITFLPNPAPFSFDAFTVTWSAVNPGTAQAFVLDNLDNIIATSNPLTFGSFSGVQTDLTFTFSSPVNVSGFTKILIDPGAVGNAGDFYISANFPIPTFNAVNWTAPVGSGVYSVGIPNFTPNFKLHNANFPSAGVNIAVSPGNNGNIPIIGANEYVKVLVYMDANGDLNVLPGTPNAVEADANVLPPPSSTLAIGYITIQQDGSSGLNPIEQSDIYQFGTGAGGGTGTGNANEFVETVKNRLNDSVFEAATPYVAQTDQDDASLVDASSTGSFDLVTSRFGLPTVGDTLQSANLLDDTFLADSKGISAVEALIKYDTDGIDTGATYELTRNGGNEWQDVTADVTRIDNTGTFRVYHEFDTEAANQTIDEYAVSNADGTQSLTDTVERIGQVFTVANLAVVRDIELYLSKTGTPDGNYYVSIIRDDSGSPSTDPSDVLYESSFQPISGLSAGNNTVNFETELVLGAGDYHIAISTDQTYKDDYSAGVDEIAVRTDSSTPGISDLQTFSSSTWAAVTGESMTYKLDGIELDLRFRVTSSVADVLVEGFAVLYEQNLGNLAVATTVEGITKVSFQAVADNLNSFTLPFLPNPDLLVVHLLGSGQSFRFGDFSLQGNTVVFPVDQFNNNNVEKGQTLIFDQIRGGAFDNSDVNASLLAANHLGSADGSLDRSVAGRGVFLRRPDGTLRELVINDNDEIEIYSV